MAPTGGPTAPVKGAEAEEVEVAQVETAEAPGVFRGGEHRCRRRPTALLARTVRAWRRYPRRNRSGAYPPAIIEDVDGASRSTDRTLQPGQTFANVSPGLHALGVIPYIEKAFTNYE
jgi:hypothetical protein